MNYVPLSSDAAELLVSAMGFIAVVVIMYVCIAFRRDRAPYLVFIGPLLGVTTLWSLGMDELEWLVLLFLETSTAGMVGYTLFRWKRVGYGPIASAVAGIANSVIVMPALVPFGYRMVQERGLWVFALMPASVVTALLLLLLVAGIRWFVRALARASDGWLQQPLAGTDASEDDRRRVLAMVAEGKVSAEEGTQLLEAMGEPATPCDRLPIRPGTLASVVGALLIVVGFMLPWNHISVKIEGPFRTSISGYQMGYSVGFLGWLILCLGLLPGLLACITALDPHLRQGMVRLLLSALGLAFTVSLIVTVWIGGYLLTLGLYFALIGFLVQLLSALVDSRLIRPPSRAALD